ncbi:bacillithiol biosynthesis cysteine-adding enzyme BshC [Leptobacterium sp. I13]|uniref:bacillithiol biosynthesis cysteine-adding enzyme BshC n=1 Tax=Leptobacterium meishanense TaxID=3128904 RepID=UPI0030EF5067
MSTDCIPFKETGYFSTLICDYIDANNSLRHFYNRYPSIENFKAQITEKATSYSQKSRDILVDALVAQHENIHLYEATKKNLSLLKNSTTYTITTGHQLNLFTGPLYFLYKIIATINLVKKLKEQYPEYDFIPIYWMATEDHDFDEIRYFNYKGKKIQWDKQVENNNQGAVGAFSNEGLEAVSDLFSKELGIGKKADAIRKLFKEAYAKHNTLSEATRYLTNELFSEYGLVIIDGNDKQFKQLFIPYMEEELLKNTSYKKVSEQAEKLNSISYNVQVNPREINLFYLMENKRERIIEKDGIYFVNDTDLQWKKDDFIKHLNKNPERFSPNVILRPLYQEVILPNLCYIGGGGEIAYWLELNSFFNAVKVPFPMLLVRNSALILSKNQEQKLKKLNIAPQQLFLKRNELINQKIKDISDISIDFTPQKNHLKEQFKALYELAKQTDKSFLGAVKAQEVKQLKGLIKLEKRLLKAQKRKLNDHVIRVRKIHEALFPNESLQERIVNFAEFYENYGNDFIKTLTKSINPLQPGFIILILK